MLNDNEPRTECSGTPWSILFQDQDILVLYKWLDK